MGQLTVVGRSSEQNRHRGNSRLRRTMPFSDAAAAPSERLRTLRSLVVRLERNWALWAALILVAVVVGSVLKSG